MRIRRRDVLIIGGLGLLSATAFAAPQNQTTDAETIAAFQKSKVSLTQAIRSAEQQSGGKALNCRFKIRRGKIFYALALLKDGVEIYGKIDSATGAWAPGDEKLYWYMQIQMGEAPLIAEFGRANKTLDQAVIEAE